MKKKLLSQILIVAMAFTMTAMPVYADENIPQDETILTEAVTEETEETAVQETLTADPAEISDAQEEAENMFCSANGRSRLRKTMSLFMNPKHGRQAHSRITLVVTESGTVRHMLSTLR